MVSTLPWWAGGEAEGCLSALENDGEGEAEVPVPLDLGSEQSSRFPPMLCSHVTHGFLGPQASRPLPDRTSTQPSVPPFH